jgi:ubiquinone/menaquinone biosynthesis C-methylase UbiE
MPAKLGGHNLQSLKPERNIMAHEHRGKSSASLLRVDDILGAIPICPGWSILDAGCGDGYMAKAFAGCLRGTGKVFASDIDGTAIDTLMRSSAETGIEAFVADITKTIPLPDASMNLVYLSTVLHGFEAKSAKRFLHEAKRILKPDGLLAIVEINPDAPFGPPPSMRFSPELLREKIGLPPKAFRAVGEHFYLQVFENAQPLLKATEITVGLHPGGFRIDKTAAPMNRYTKWIVTASGDWTNPEPVCFHSLPETGWKKAERFDWGDTRGEA